jgi:hypothetical protein
MTFLLVWDKDSYTGSFLVMFPCIYVLYSQLAYLLWLSTFCHSPFLMVGSASLRFSYSFLYRDYITCIQVLSCLLLPSPSRAWSPLSVTSVCIRSIFHIWERTCSFWHSESG